MSTYSNTTIHCLLLIVTCVIIVLGIKKLMIEYIADEYFNKILHNGYTLEFCEDMIMNYYEDDKAKSIIKVLKFKLNKYEKR